MRNGKPLTPIRPAGMEMIFLYPCPFCRRMVPLANPIQPSMAQCDSCHEQFPIVPVDERSIRFVKIMLHNGKAGIDPDFL